MIKYENQNGYIEITNNYFSNLVGNAAQSCFGVTRMVNPNPYQSKVENENHTQGVIVKSINGSLVVDLHIAVSYGVNISAITDSIINKVRYIVESATDLNVSKVNVHVDELN